jgi:quinol monooxygenase YgiN
MFARSTWIQARVPSLDAGVDMIRNDVLPAVQAMDGCIGLSMMADRKSGRCIVTSAWESTDAMHASDSAVAHLRERAGKLLGGEPYVEEWEIAALHRHHHSHQGACARVVWMHGMPPATAEKIEQSRDFFKMVMLPTLEQTEGFCSASLFLDPATMRTVSSVVWDSRAAMEASRDSAARLKESARTQLAVDILDVAEFDLLIAHLRAPEMV